MGRVQVATPRQGGPVRAVRSTGAAWLRQIGSAWQGAGRLAGAARLAACVSQRTASMNVTAAMPSAIAWWMRTAMGFPTVTEWADHVERPQRLRTVQVLGHQPADRPPEVGPARNQLRWGCRRTWSRMSKSIALDPARLRAGGVDALGGARMARKPLCHCISKRFEVERGCVGLEHVELQRVPHDDGRFQAQDSRVVESKLIGVVRRGHRASVFPSSRIIGA